jgi:hypothetical protein
VAEDIRPAKRRSLESLTIVPLGPAAIATAWATFQAAHWRSEQALAGRSSPGGAGLDRDEALDEPQCTVDTLRDAAVHVGSVTGGRRARGPRPSRSALLAGRYALGVVLFATSLFFAGVSARLTDPRSRVVVLVMGWAMFAGSLAWMATFPVTL